jgi:hypothetical protein
MKDGEKSNRKFTRLKGNIDLKDFGKDVSSGNFTHLQIKEKFKITHRQLNYLINKYNIKNNLIFDRSYMKTEEYSKKISEGNKNKVRTELHKQHYREAVARREIKNNIGSGWHHSQETIEKITLTNMAVWEKELPQAWIDSCINNELWYKKLKESAKNKLPRTLEHTIKIVESKVGMPYEKWIYVRGLFNSYRANVRTITDIQPLYLLDNFNKRGRKYHLDHMFSICEGFRQNIAPEIIGNIVNLKIITTRENCTKNKKCSITLDQLLEAYYEYTRLQK